MRDILFIPFGTIIYLGGFFFIFMRDILFIPLAR